MIAPVSVARLITPVGSNRSCAYHRTSARTKRPSASVLMISTVSPFMDFTTSPGRVAVLEGMFSTRPTRPTTFALALRRASARMTPDTTPAPPMSMVMSSIPAAGLRLIPPVSNTTPLPTKAKGAASAAPPFQRMTTTLDGLAEPWPTDSNRFMPNSANSASSRISTSSPSSCIAARRAAKSSVVRMLAGSFTRSRVKNTPSATAAIGPALAASSSGLDAIMVTGPRVLGSSDLCGPKS